MIIAVINNKGGTGKTTTSVNLGAAFAELGYNVLLVDLDPQASASISLGATFATLSPSVSNVLFDDLWIKSAIRSTQMPGLSLLTADVELYNRDLNLANVSGRENRLRVVLDTVADQYDFIVCDCPPSFSMVSISALVAADAYVVPVTPDYLALQDLACITGMVEELRSSMSIDAELLGIVVTKTPNARSFLNSRARLARENISELRKRYEDDVFTTEIATDRKLAEAPAYGSTVFGNAKSSRGAKQYLALAEELTQRCGILKLKAESRRLARMRRKEREQEKSQYVLPPRRITMQWLDDVDVERKEDRSEA